MEQQVKAQYNTRRLKKILFQTLDKSAEHNASLELKDLSPVDQLHTGGAKATLDLLKKARLFPGAEVLDAGCGIGGSSRLMAKTFDFIVTGIDLSDSFIEAAVAITDRFHLSDQVYFRQGSILNLPFEDQSFDAVLCQHVLMNIDNKAKAFKEFNRVLKKGGQLVLHEIVKGENEPVMYPVPWGKQERISFLISRQDMVRMIEQAGFKQQMIRDWTQSAIDWWLKAKSAAKKQENNPPDLGPHLIFGEQAKLFPKTMNYNLKWNRIQAVEAIYLKG